MFTKKKLSKICAKAEDVILTRGFQKGFYGSAEGPVCAAGALRVAAHGGSPTLSIYEKFGDEASRQVEELFKAVRPRSRRHSIEDFNDAKRTRKHDVLELLRDMSDQALA